MCTGEGGGFEKERPSVRDVSPSPRKDRHVLGSNDQAPKRFITISQHPLRVMYDEEAGRISPASSPRSSAGDGALRKISSGNLLHDGPIGDVELRGRRGSRMPAAPPPRTDRDNHVRPCSKARGYAYGYGERASFSSLDRTTRRRDVVGGSSVQPSQMPLACGMGEKMDCTVLTTEKRSNGSGVVVQDAGMEALVRYRQRVSLGSSFGRCYHPLQDRRVRFHHHPVLDLQRTQPRRMVSTRRSYVLRRSVSKNLPDRSLLERRRCWAVP